MKTVLKTNNHITLSWIKHILSCNNIKFYILDESMSSVEGNITAIPMRILVDTENLKRAKKIISDAEDELKKSQYLLLIELYVSIAMNFQPIFFFPVIWIYLLYC